jgi:hypothetical protein
MAWEVAGRPALAVLHDERVVGTKHLRVGLTGRVVDPLDDEEVLLAALHSGHKVGQQHLGWVVPRRAGRRDGSVRGHSSPPFAFASPAIDRP